MRNPVGIHAWFLRVLKLTPMPNGATHHSPWQVPAKPPALLRHVDQLWARMRSPVGSIGWIPGFVVGRILLVPCRRGRCDQLDNPSSSPDCSAEASQGGQESPRSVGNCSAEASQGGQESPRSVDPARAEPKFRPRDNTKYETTHLPLTPISVPSSQLPVPGSGFPVPGSNIQHRAPGALTGTTRSPGP